MKSNLIKLSFNLLIKCGLKHKLLPGYFLSLAAAHSLQCCHNSLITFSLEKTQFVHRSIEIERLAIKTVKIVVHGRIHINNFFDKSDLCFRAWNFFTFVFFFLRFTIYQTCWNFNQKYLCI